MTGSPPLESLPAFVETKEHDSSEPAWSAQVVNRTDPQPIQTMAEELYESLDIETSETELAGFDDDLFVVICDGRIVASSPVQTLKETLLMVNSDLYKTGSASVREIDVPDVILELSDTVFTLKGFPKSNTGKLVLTLIARYIEQQAVLQQSGTLRTSFQKLSRLDDEQGTWEVYEQLGAIDELQTHVYGYPDWNPLPELDLLAHEVRNPEIRESWFVVYSAESVRDAAMLAVNTGSQTWKGYWTFDADEIRRLDDFITRTF